MTKPFSLIVVQYFRVVFPLSYLIINIFYWNYYLGAQETVDTTVETFI